MAKSAHLKIYKNKNKKKLNVHFKVVAFQGFKLFQLAVGVKIPAVCRHLVVSPDGVAHARQESSSDSTDHHVRNTI